MSRYFLDKIKATPLNTPIKFNHKNKHFYITKVSDFKECYFNNQNKEKNCLGTIFCSEYGIHGFKVSELKGFLKNFKLMPSQNIRRKCANSNKSIIPRIHKKEKPFQKLFADFLNKEKIRYKKEFKIDKNNKSGRVDFKININKSILFIELKSDFQPWKKSTIKSQARGYSDSFSNNKNFIGTIVVSQLGIYGVPFKTIQKHIKNKNIKYLSNQSV